MSAKQFVPRPTDNDFAPTMHSHSMEGEQQSRGSGFEVSLLFLCGLATLCGGLALSILPNYSWSAANVAAQCAQVGVQGGAVAIGGVVLLGLAFVRRAQGRPTRNESNPMLEQVVTDLALVHGQVEEVMSRCERLTGSVDVVAHELAKLREQRTQEPPRQVGNEDALFGLASSLDKLGLRLEQRFKAQQRALMETLEQMNANLGHAHQALVEQLASYAPQPLAVHVDEPPAALPAPSEDDAPKSSLGLLDSIDDDGATQRPEPMADAGHLDFDQLDRIERQLATNGPGQSWEEQLNMVEQHDSARTKLDQLENLLADPELRALIEGLRQH